jgi:cell division protein FtsA
MKKKNRTAPQNDPNLLVGLDLGSSNTRVIIARRNDEQIEMIGYGSSPSLGSKHGFIINIEQTVDSILTAVEKAETMANTTISTAHVAISGDHIRSVSSKGVIPLGKIGSSHGVIHQISLDDVQRVIDTAREVVLPSDRDIIHVLPQDYLVDDRIGYKDPVGISGLRLQANVHVITAALTAVQTIQYCLQQAHVHLQDLVFSGLAASQGVLTQDECDLGVALVDIGGGTTDLIVYEEGAVRYTAVIGMGGEDVTKDLAHGLRLSRAEAEKLKLDCGCAHPSKLFLTEPVPLPGGDGRRDRQVAQDIVCAVIQPRLEEIFDLVIRELRQADYLNRLTAGVVLVGGCARIPGAVELAEEAFAMPARLGSPQGLLNRTDTADPTLDAVITGLVLHVAERQEEAANDLKPAKRKVLTFQKSDSKIHNFTQWIAEIF